MSDSMNEILRKRWAVVGFDYNTAEQLISNIEISSGKEILRRKRIKDFEICTYFTDGTTLRWVEASESSKAQRYGKMWCDKNINKNVLKCVIMRCYFGKKEDIIWL